MFSKDKLYFNFCRIYKKIYFIIRFDFDVKKILLDISTKKMF